MKIIKKEFLINVNNTDSLVAQRIQEVEQAILQVTNSPDSKSFLLYSGLQQDGKHLKKPNGVTPIKTNFVSHLENKGWLPEQTLDFQTTLIQPGKVDAIFRDNIVPCAAEWETGNIASSHRALNKLTIGLLNGTITAGFLVLPSRSMYRYLTDRVGNYIELEPYFDVWRKANYNINKGLLAVYEIEHDFLTDDPFFRIPKGTDGRALR
jgi:hypothetical protein